jgi:hypothetical protein
VEVLQQPWVIAVVNIFHANLKGLRLAENERVPQPFQGCDESHWNPKPKVSRQTLGSNSPTLSA